MRSFPIARFGVAKRQLEASRAERRKVVNDGELRATRSLPSPGPCYEYDRSALYIAVARRSVKQSNLRIR